MTPVAYDLIIDPHNEMQSHAWLLRFSQGAALVLDVGCATGSLGGHLAAQGSRVLGVEIEPAAAKLAQASCSAVIVGDIEASRVQAQIQGPFDALILGDVLEHLREPASLLRHAHTWLSPTGRVILSVPNSAHWAFRREVARGRFPSRSQGLFDANHLHFFTQRSLKAMIAGCGYAIEQEAVTVNWAQREDVTFILLAGMYRRPLTRDLLIRFEHRLAVLWPTLFAYQFVLCLKPEPVSCQGRAS